MISLLEKIRPLIIEWAFLDQVEDKPICQEESVEWGEQNGWRILLERAPGRLGTFFQIPRFYRMGHGDRAVSLYEAFLTPKKLLFRRLADSCQDVEVATSAGAFRLSKHRFPCSAEAQRIADDGDGT